MEKKRTDLLLEKLTEAERKVDELERSNFELRSIILRNTGKQKVPDKDIIADFSSLRQQIQAISQNPVFSVMISKPLNLADWKSDRKFDSMAKFYGGLWEKLSPANRKTRMRAEIFEILNNYILSSTCFGLEGLEAESNKVESGLAYFERMMERHHG